MSRSWCSPKPSVEACVIHSVIIVIVVVVVVVVAAVVVVATIVCFFEYLKYSARSIF